MNMNSRMKQFATMHGGRLPHCTAVGFYPMFYITRQGEAVCPSCANAAENTHPIVAERVNWEMPDLYCDCCSGSIPSAYGEEDEE